MWHSLDVPDCPPRQTVPIIYQQSANTGETHVHRSGCRRHSGGVEAMIIIRLFVGMVIASIAMFCFFATWGVAYPN
jgi:hypothetical protein